MDRLEGCVRLQHLLILVPVRRLLVNINESELYSTIYELTKNVRARIEDILASYEIGITRSPEDKIARMIEELSQNEFFGKITIGLQNGKISSIKKEESLKLEDI